MKIIFMGTPDFALDSLIKIYDNYDVISVFTKIDKPNMRGGKIKFNPIKEFALKHDIPVYQPVKLNDPELIDKIKESAPDLIVVVAYGKIIPQEIIDIPKYGIINLHSSLLPKYRGAAPINAAIMNGEKETGVTVMYIIKELDAGDMILSSKTQITDEDDFGSLHDRLKEMGSNTLIEAMKLIFSNNVRAQKQDEKLVSFVRPFKKEDLKINWAMGSGQIFDFVRGLSPVPGAHTFIDGKQLKIYHVTKNEKVYDKGVFGEVVDILKNKGPVIKTKDGSVIIMQGRPENKKTMSGNDMMNGHILKLGDTLS